MEPYARLSRDSGITHYEIGPTFVRVRFNSGDIYVYDHASAGQIHVERLKQLALSGRGLSTYISRHLRHAYARKE